WDATSAWISASIIGTVLPATTGRPYLPRSTVPSINTGWSEGRRMGESRLTGWTRRLSPGSTRKAGRGGLGRSRGRGGGSDGEERRALAESLRRCWGGWNPRGELAEEEHPVATPRRPSSNHPSFPSRAVRGLLI